MALLRYKLAAAGTTMPREELQERRTLHGRVGDAGVSPHLVPVDETQTCSEGQEVSSISATLAHPH